MRPPSIVRFDQLYGAAFALQVLNTILSWQSTQATQATVAAQFGPWLLPAATAVGVVVPLLLWFFVARRASLVAKWIAVVLTAIAVAALGFGAVRGTLALGGLGLLGIGITVLRVIAVAFLFRPDAQEWLGEFADEPLEEEADA